VSDHPGLWHDLSDKGRYLYHYTKLDTALNYIIPSMTLKLAKLENLNDPREYKDWALGAIGLVGRDSEQEVRKAIELSHGLNRAIRSMISVACFCRDITDASAPDADIVHQAYERGHSRSRMWAQYADNYEGVCLVFDRPALLSAFNEFAVERKLALRYGEVTYRNRSPGGSFFSSDETTIDLRALRELGFAQYVGHHLRQHFEGLILTKSKDWCDEREFRIALLGPPQQDILLPLGTSLVGLGLGDRSVGRMKETRELCWAKGIEFAYFGWLNGYPQPTQYFQQSPGSSSASIKIDVRFGWE
jgi:hypothetical protein